MIEGAGEINRNNQMFLRNKVVFDKVSWLGDSGNSPNVSLKIFAEDGEFLLKSVETGSVFG